MASGAGFLGGRITVSTEPFFWLMAGIMGMSFGRGSPQEIILWAGVVGFSVLFHELGHAAVCLVWGEGADIILHGMGGATRPRDVSKFGTWRTAILNLAGCAAGLGLAVVIIAALVAAKKAGVAVPPHLKKVAVGLIEINVWFSLFNLLPVGPMDGGKLVAGLLSARWGVNGLRAANVFGVVLGTALALWFAGRKAIYGTVLCGAMAVGEARALKRSWSMTAADSDETLKAEPARAAELWERERREEAVEVLKALREKTGGAGLIYMDATLQLAFYEYMLGRTAEAYSLFKLIPESDLPPAAKHAYADAALKGKDFEVALRLGRTNFHDSPGADTGLAAARAAAGLGDARETVQWLKAALRQGLEPAELRAKEFDALRGSEEFRELEDDLKKA
ncbi:MAG: hypothetical protein M0D55_20520 [Elusimicrobiota bacterium]|nr:MAG: hypothetical protein M0D55_20520 [Elusimicrobiota bacterium]